MARRKLSYKQHNKRFKRARSKTRAVNSPAFVLRGGRRL